MPDPAATDALIMGRVSVGTARARLRRRADAQTSAAGRSRAGLLWLMLTCALLLGLGEAVASPRSGQCSVDELRAATGDLDDRTQSLLVADYTDRGVDSLVSFLPAAAVVVDCAALNQGAGEDVRRDIVRASSSALALALSYKADQLDGRVAGPLFLIETLLSIDGPITRFMTSNPAFVFGERAPRHWLPPAFLNSRDPVTRQQARAMEIYALCKIWPEEFLQVADSLGYARHDIAEIRVVSGAPDVNRFLSAKIQADCS